MLIQISQATLSDIDQVVRLNGVVQDVHVQMRPDVFRADWDVARVNDFWRAHLQDEASVVALATLDGEVVGYVWFKVEDRPLNQFTFEMRRLYVHHIAVDEKVRRHKVESMLLDYVEGEARRLDIDDIALDTWSSNVSAQAFFASRGYDPLKMVLTKTAGG